MARWLGRRRRKPRVVWLPNTGTQMGTGRSNTPLDNAAAIEIAATVTGDTGEVFSTPLVIDNPPERTFVGATLPVLQTSALNQTLEFGYRLRRIVGRMQIAMRCLDQVIAFPAFWIKAGIIVRRVDEQGVSTLNVSDVDPTRLKQVSDPWIWQRNFVISPTNFGNGPPDVGSGAAATINLFLPQTRECGGTKDGPAVDIKTARRLGPEERLFLDVAVEGLPLSANGGGVTNDNTFMYFLFDYRVLGTIYTNSGNRRNASR